MNFDFSDDHKQLRDHLRRFLAERCTSQAVRAVYGADAPIDRALLRGLAELGVLGAGIPEAYGGLGTNGLETCILAEELGRVLAPVPVFPSIYVAAEAIMLAGSEAQKLRWLPALASGEAIATFAFADPAAVHFDGSKVNGVAAPVPDAMVANVVLVAAQAPGSPCTLALVESGAGGVTCEPLPSIDPTRGQARIRFDGAAAEPLGEAQQGGAILSQVMDRAATFLAFEQVGGAERTLEMARDYALERMAFGRPIGSFQAIKHMLANMYVSATLARSNAYYAAWAMTTGAPELATAAASARISATDAFQECARNSIQVHGGMGFTFEVDCHLYYRRSNALALALGSMTTWSDRLVEGLAAA